MTSDKKVLYALFRSNLSAFVQKVFQTVSLNDQYSDNWHIHAICYQLMRVALGETKRLIITIPPRHMKSISVSIAFVAWMLGRNPKNRIICASYAQDLASYLSMQTRTVMESEWYGECFKGTQLSDAKNTQSEFWTTEQGYRMATSGGGPLTGKGADILIVDDIIKADDAHSESKRKQAIDWFKTTAATRLNDPKNGIIIVIQQRLHEADLPGELLESGGWDHLNLPAIAEVQEQIPIGPNQFHERKPGDVLHEARMSMADLDKIKHDIGSYNFAGQYQQRPAPAGGGIVKWAWFKRFDLIDGKRFPRQFGDRIFQSWDIAYTLEEMSNYSVCMTFLYRNYRMYLLSIRREKLDTPQLLKEIPSWAAKYKAEVVILEKSGVGGALLQLLRKQELDADEPTVQYVPHEPREDKATRLMQVTPTIEQGLVLLPNAEREYLNVFRHELESFPNGKYDDQVDAFSQAVLWMLYNTPAPPPGTFGGAGASGDGDDES